MTQYMNKFAAQSEEEEDERLYRAWRHYKASREIRLQIRDAMGRRFTVPYASVLLVQYMPPSKISIFCTHLIINITGENLERLEEFLQDEKIRYIQAFNAKHFDEPAANEGKVTDITIEWTRKGMEPEEAEKREQETPSLKAS